MNDRGNTSLHDVFMMMLSDMVALERNMPHMQPTQVKRQIRSIASQMSEYLPEVEEFDQIQGKVMELERRVRILGLGRGGNEGV
jgi:polyhydroxyalkanoate synthesis regulator phasin